jgi:hypothetical protein
VGKGGHVRTVPVPDWVKQFLDDWFTAAQITTGKLFRCVCRSGTIWGDGMTEKVVWHVVKIDAKKLEMPKLASRSPQIVRTLLPCRRRRVGTDSVLARSCIRANDGAVLGLQTTISTGCKRSDRHRTGTLKTERARSTPAQLIYRIADTIRPVESNPKATLTMELTGPPRKADRGVRGTVVRSSRDGGGNRSFREFSPTVPGFRP